MEFAYDVDGERILERDAEGTRLRFLGGRYVWRVGEGSGVVSYFAFGRRLAYKEARNVSLRAAGPPAAGPPAVDPRVVGWGLACAGALGLVALLARLGALEAARRRPGSALLSGLLVTNLAVPPPVWGGGGPPGPGEGTSFTWRWIGHDHLGSEVLFMNWDGEPLERRVFEPFGEVVEETDWGTEAFPRVFAGQIYEPTAGLYDFRARWQDSEAGRFLSVDPLIQFIGDPQTHNAYGYVRNNPATFVDPTGASFDFTVGIVQLLAMGIGLGGLGTVDSLGSKANSEFDENEFFEEIAAEAASAAAAASHPKTSGPDFGPEGVGHSDDDGPGFLPVDAGDVVIYGLVAIDLALGGPTGEGVVPAMAILVVRTGSRQAAKQAAKNLFRSTAGNMAKRILRSTRHGGTGKIKGVGAGKASYRPKLDGSYSVTPRSGRSKDTIHFRP